MRNNNLRWTSIVGIFWKMSERIYAQLVSLIVSIILARILMPEDYSVVGIVTIFFAFANIIISGGFNSALIQKKDADSHDYNSVLIITVVSSLVLYLILFVFAPQLAELFNKKILVIVIRVMGVILFINSFKSVLVAYTSSKLQFKTFFLSTSLGTTVSAVIGIMLALNGYGVWALVFQQMSNSLIDTIVLAFVTKYRIKFTLEVDRLRKLFKYGWKIYVSSFISITYEQIMPLVIGVKFTTTDLAFFNKGQSFPSVISSTISDSFSSVLFPIMSKLQDDKTELLEYLRRFIGISSYIVFPLMLGLFSVTDNVIVVLLTDKWLPAAAYMKIFCLTYMFIIIQNGNLHAIKALGRSDVILKLDIIKKALYFSVLFLFIFNGSSPIMLAFAYIVNTCIATVINTYPNRKLIGYRYLLQFKDIALNLFSALLMAMIVMSMNGLKLPLMPLLLGQIAVGIVSYVVISIVFHNPNYTYIKSLAIGILGKMSKKICDIQKL